jgi:hypothetical protein
MLPLRAEIFIVTSNFHPRDVYIDKEGVPHAQTEALERRLQIIEIKKEDEDARRNNHA